MNRKQIGAGVAALIIAGLSLTGCNKAAQYGKDASRNGNNSDPAQTIEMPDGFNNAATKCDHGNRIYTLFHGDSVYGGIAVVAHDPSCN